MSFLFLGLDTSRAMLIIFFHKDGFLCALLYTIFVNSYFYSVWWSVSIVQCDAAREECLCILFGDFRVIFVGGA